MDKALKLVKRFYIDQSDQYFKTLYKIEKRLDKGINKEILHSVRLNIKNIKAVHQFFKIMEIENKSIEKLDDQIDKINKPLGRIRERQVNKQLAKKNLLNTTIQKAYLAFLKDQMDKDYSKLKKNLTPASLNQKTFHYNKINKELIRKEENHISPKLNIFLLEKVDFINQLLLKLTDETQLHQIRKSLKIIKSVLTILKIEGITDIKEFKRELNSAEQQIGNWHDSIVFRDSLIEFCLANKEFESGVTMNLELIEAGNLMFHSELPVLIDPILKKLETDLKK
jgi:CHAD domain-containing protein